MRFWYWLSFTLSLPVLASDHLVVRINKNGVNEILQKSLAYTQHITREKPWATNKNFALSIPRQNFAESAVFRLFSQLTNIEELLAAENGDVKYSLHLHSLWVNWQIEPASVSIKILSHNPRQGGRAESFDVEGAFRLQDLRVDIPRLTICHGHRCPGNENVIKATARRMWFSTIGSRKPEIKGRFRVTLQNNRMAKVDTISITSNLAPGHRQRPQLRVNPGEIQLPEVSITVDGQTVTIDNSAVENEVEKVIADMAGPMIVDEAGKFLGAQLASMLDQTLARQSIPTNLEVIRMDSSQVGAVISQLVMNSNNGQQQMEQLQRDLTRILRSAKLGVELTGAPVTPLEQDIELRSRLNLELSGREAQVGNTYRQPGGRELPLGRLDLSRPNIMNREHHLALGFSESALNAAFKLLKDVGLNTALVRAKVPQLKDLDVTLKAHFKHPDVYLIAQISFSLGQVDTGDWWQNFLVGLGGVCEWVHETRGSYHFPIELKARPALVVEGGKHVLKITVQDPFNEQSALLNTFAYPSNISRSCGVVRNEIIKKLKDGILPLLAKPFIFPVDELLSQGPLKVSPRDFKVVNGSYLYMAGDITQLDIRSMIQTPAER